MMRLMNVLDAISSVTSLTATVYFIRLAPSAWVMSVLAITLNSMLYWRAGIYADMGLELIYLLMSCYGLFKWKTTSYSQTVKIKPLVTINLVIKTALAVSCLFIFVYWLLTTYTQSTVPLVDALTTALSLVAQWLMCKKLIMTWIVWFVADAIYSYLYYLKQLPFHTALMIIYCILALKGYFSWSKKDKFIHGKIIF